MNRRPTGFHRSFMGSGPSLIHSCRAAPCPTMSSASIEPLAEREHQRHTAVVRELVQELGHLSPALRDDRLVRRFAETRGFSRRETKKLLLQYATYRVERGLDDDSLPREAGVTAEMRERHTMRLLDPRHAPGERRTTDVGSDARAEQERALTFLALSTPSAWPTARDKDGCPVIYTNVEQYARGASKAVEATLVWTCELVCREMDRELADDGNDAAHEGKFTILLDLTSCVHVHLPAFCKLGEILQRALKRGFRGRLHRFYLYPTGRRGRVLLRLMRPLLGRYTPPKIKLVDRGDLDRLAEIFPREILPPHLGGTSRLLSVAFEDEVEPRDARDARDARSGFAREDARDGTPTAKAEERFARSANDETADGHGDLRWFLRVPALNFAVIAAMTACSASLAPRIPLVGTARGSRTQIEPDRESGTVPAGKARRWARALAASVANFFVWRTVGWDVCGIERSGAWSTAVMLVSGAWRGRRVGRT